MLKVVFHNFPSKKGFPIIIDSISGGLGHLSNPGAISQTLLFFKNEVEEVDFGARKDLLNCRFRSDSHLVTTLHNLFPKRLKKTHTLMYLTLSTVNQLYSFFFFLTG